MRTHRIFFICTLCLEKSNLPLKAHTDGLFAYVPGKFQNSGSEGFKKTPYRLYDIKEFLSTEPRQAGPSQVSARQDVMQSKPSLPTEQFQRTLTRCDAGHLLILALTFGQNLPPATKQLMGGY